MVLSAQPLNHVLECIAGLNFVTCLFSYSSPNIFQVIKSRRMRWAGYVACMEERRGVYRASMGIPKGKRPFGRARCRWEDIKMDLQKVGCGSWNWIKLAQDRDRWRALNAVMNLQVPYSAGNFLTS
jgi:hypothetical protein